VKKSKKNKNEGRKKSRKEVEIVGGMEKKKRSE